VQFFFHRKQSRVLFDSFCRSNRTPTESLKSYEEKRLEVEKGRQCMTIERNAKRLVVRASQTGNHQAKRHVPTVTNDSYSELPDEFWENIDDAEDALQEGLLSAYRNLSRLRDACKFSTWLTRIVLMPHSCGGRGAKGLTMPRSTRPLLQNMRYRGRARPG